MDILIWVGVIVSAAGLGGLVWTIVRVASARRRNLPDAELRAELQKALPLNLGALFLSVIGLMLVVVGIFLG
ncbi:hypothetical protein SAMN05421853_102361 [Roseivivax halotolerans]|jgi:hypothetical protein|uniref:Uncharacterized protein n=1 Tax=Roseivivax halotolerans TaxID=93684 RepID=A0A1I5WHK1_9RHOB|nr:MULTISPECIES: hypothetical protein [Roseivivax]QFT64255.1 hypothetical protein FIU91_15050 [Roseivivax sp. THAF30]SFQ19272.1 hypothetical protein SAMN05421853_102361 [Roseivivax halotolerans]